MEDELRQKPIDFIEKIDECLEAGSLGHQLQHTLGNRICATLAESHKDSAQAGFACVAKPVRSKTENGYDE
ncbi:hypothetical protein SAMD00079811_15120 [Scytonema sp. HK-05]|uniref:hypothetical protein n=1 Tax=Scytonema sp. HK-05 TaxID=1137095 RepID=UPI000937478B|nr:hypothetical protein [Scytonema sp. HK-05]OKH58321.1 hypothetical protein NIES2130_14670 [Scytonema sp. HK-05]BAY43919.1 hypothetical protein SAMD00079811_15120 [Scytonema sp. HK-05]